MLRHGWYCDRGSHLRGLPLTATYFTGDNPMSTSPDAPAHPSQSPWMHRILVAFLIFLVAGIGYGCVVRPSLPLTVVFIVALFVLVLAVLSPDRLTERMCDV
jgi:hypothetical protein